MDLKQIKELMAAMGRTRTKRLRIKNEDFELELEKEDKVVKQVIGQQASPMVTEVIREVHKASDIPASLQPPVHHEPEVEEETGQYIISPMVGTYYAASGPDDPHFVKVGDMVEDASVVCIIEAMKVMNEVKAGCSGKVTEILVESGHPVEFGTKLFKVS